jgi:hypothetical protein
MTLPRGCARPRPGYAELKRRSVPLNANASGIWCTPTALLAHAGCGLADTVHHYPACLYALPR